VGVEAGAAVLRRRVVRQHDECDVRRIGMDGAQHVHTGAADELVIEQHVIGVRPANSVDRLAGRAGFADHFDAVDAVDQFAQAIAHRREVVDDEDVGACWRVHGWHCRHP